MQTLTPKIYLFHCATKYDHRELMRSFPKHLNDTKVISMPCSGKLDILYLTKAFDTGADGAAIMICKEGECRYMEGNFRAKKRAQAVDELLQEAGLRGGRIKVIQLDDGGLPEAIRKLDDFQLHIMELIQNDKTLQPSATK